MSDQPPVAAVVFDFGGVLISPITNVLDEIAAWHDIEMTAMLELLMGPRETSTADHPWHRAERGELAVSEMQEALGPWADAAGVDLRGDEYERLLRGDFEVHDEVVARIAPLNDDGYATALLTNSLRESRALIERTVDFGLFDVVVDSSEVGCRKPEPAIFEETTRRLGVRPDEILFLDDFAANIDGAGRAGWRTIHVTDRTQILPSLDAALDR